MLIFILLKGSLWETLRRRGIGSEAVFQKYPRRRGQEGLKEGIRPAFKMGWLEPGLSYCGLRGDGEEAARITQEDPG